MSCAAPQGGEDALHPDRPHALTSSALGRSQKEVAKLFHQVIPEFAADGPCIVLLDEVETLAPDRQRMSLEANPIDVHRATDAALAGLDLLTRKHRNVLLVATTNYPKAVDRALMSRADWIEQIGLPDAEARAEIIADTLDRLAPRGPVSPISRSSIGAFVAASEGLDGRRLRKTIVSAAARRSRQRSDLNKLKAEHVLAALESGKGRSGREGRMKIRRNIASVPVRSAKETWRAIIDLVTGDGRWTAQQLDAAASIMDP